MRRRFARQAIIDQLLRIEEMTARLLCYAAKEGMHVELSWLLTNGGANPDSKEDDGVSALSHAAERGRATCVTALLKSGADADTQDKGATPIISACIEGHLDVVLALLAHGASLTPRHLRLTAVQWAHHRGHTEPVRELQQGSARAHIPPPHAFGERVRVDPAVNRLVDSAAPCERDQPASPARLPPTPAAAHPPRLLPRHHAAQAAPPRSPAPPEADGCDRYIRRPACRGVPRQGELDLLLTGKDGARIRCRRGRGRRVRRRVLWRAAAGL